MSDEKKPRYERPDHFSGRAKTTQEKEDLKKLYKAHKADLKGKEESITLTMRIAGKKTLAYSVDLSRQELEKIFDVI